MSLFDITAILLTLAAVFGFANTRWLRLPPTVGVLAISLAVSLAMMLLDRLLPALELLPLVRRYLDSIDFNAALMHGMLGFLLFAGALHADLDYFMRRRWTIVLLSTVGLLISTAVVGVLSWRLFALLGLPASLPACLVFGALISPTDPIAVMGTLKTLHAPPSLEAKIGGESLFNDGVAVVVFTALVTLLPAGSDPHAAGGHAGLDGPPAVLLFFLREAGGGGALGLAAGWVAYRMMLAIDDYKVEVLITLALVMGGYALAERLMVSGPIAMVAAGLLIGNRGRHFAMSPTVTDYLEKFWELVDEFLNAVLFLLIGVEVLVVALRGRLMLAGLAAVAIVLLARWISVSIPILMLKWRLEFSQGVIRILTWSGLRGGISVALALSLPPVPEKPAILACTYTVVLFSILVQGLTIRRVLRRFI